jgi:hypothetical protein
MFDFNYESKRSVQIINELPKIWKKFEQKGLIKELTKVGFTYSIFLRLAIQQSERGDRG